MHGTNLSASTQNWNRHLKLVLQSVKVGGGEKDGFSILANSTTWNAKPYDITSTVARMFLKL